MTAITVELDATDWSTHLAEETRRGLLDTPPWTPPVWFYDEVGSALFDEITRLPEYYPTRAERSILEARADRIAAITGADVLVELGSGTSEKTRLLLHAIRPKRFVPFDVSEAPLRAATEALAVELPDVEVRAVVGDFHRHLGRIPRVGRRLVAFLGGTIGNLDPAQRAKFLFDVDAMLEHDEWLLLGTDLVKDRGRLVAAYDDAAGVTAAFNRNVLRVLNAELGGDFDADAFEHVARWNEDARWIEMRLRSRRAQVVTLAAVERTVRFAAGEEVRTEISAKFTPEQVDRELRAAGFRPAHGWSDPAGDFLLTLGTPV